MPVGWYIVPYVRGANRVNEATGEIAGATRYCQINNDTLGILNSGGQWSEVEVLGNRAIVKVRASTLVLTTLSALYKRLPKDSLNSPLSDLTLLQKNALRDELLDMGYRSDEITTRFGSDLGNHTLGDVLRFMATRRRKPRYDRDTDSIVLDGVELSCESVDTLDRQVT